MELERAISSRRMTRRFSPEDIEEERLLTVLSSARFAPSAGLAQGVDLLVLRAPERRAAFWELASDEGWRNSGAGAADLMAAPVVVVPVADPDAYARRYSAPDKADTLLFSRPVSTWPVPYWLVDAAFATMLVLLAANDVDLGALFFQLHAEASVVLGGLGVPAGRTTIGAVALGQRAAAPGRARPVRSARPLVHLDTW